MCGVNVKKKSRIDHKMVSSEKFDYPIRTSGLDMYSECQKTDFYRKSFGETNSGAPNKCASVNPLAAEYVRCNYNK